MKRVKLHHRSMSSIIKAGKAVYSGDVFTTNSLYVKIKIARRNKEDLLITLQEVKQLIQWFNYSYKDDAAKHKAYKHLASLEFALIFGVEDDVAKYLY